MLFKKSIKILGVRVYGLEIYIHTFFSVGEGAMNALRYWQLRDDACTLYRLGAETSANSPSFSYPHGAMNFLAALAIKILIANSCIRDDAESLKGSHRTGDGPILLRTSVPHSFNDNLSKEPILSARSISLDGTFKV